LRFQLCAFAGVCPIAWSEGIAVDTVVDRGRSDTFLREPLSQCFTPREHGAACTQRSQNKALQSGTCKERVHVATLNRGREREIEFIGQQHHAMRVGIRPVDQYDVESSFSNYRVYGARKQPSIQRSRKERD